MWQTRQTTWSLKSYMDDEIELIWKIDIYRAISMFD